MARYKIKYVYSFTNYFRLKNYVRFKINPVHNTGTFYNMFGFELNTDELQKANLNCKLYLFLFAILTENGVVFD